MTEILEDVYDSKERLPFCHIAAIWLILAILLWTEGRVTYLVESIAYSEIIPGQGEFG